MSTLNNNGPQPYDVTEPLKKDTGDNNPEKMIIMTGNIHPDLAAKVAYLLNTQAVQIQPRTFPNRETQIQLPHSVRDKKVFLIQPLTWRRKNPNEIKPDENIDWTVEESLFQLCNIIYTLRSSTVDTITAIIPYLCFQQSDKKDQPHVAITAKLIADLIQASGLHHKGDGVVLEDLHAAQIQGFFDATRISVDHLYASYVLIPFLQNYFSQQNISSSDIVIASPDAGGTHRAEFYSKYFGNKTAYGHKERDTEGKSKLIDIVGDVKGKIVVLCDDIINSGGSMIDFAKMAMEKGARAVYAVAAHGGFTTGSIQNMENSQIAKIFVTDSTPPRPGIEKSTKIETVSIARMLAQAIYNIFNGHSVSNLFIDQKTKKMFQ